MAGCTGHIFRPAAYPIGKSDRAGLAGALAGLTITLYRNDEAIDEGVGANVLDGPIQALAHLVDVLGRDPHSPPLRAGEMVTTGTLTRAFPVMRGERWSTRIEGIEMAPDGDRDQLVAGASGLFDPITRSWASASLSSSASSRAARFSASTLALTAANSCRGTS